jgi:hypothetical protein
VSAGPHKEWSNPHPVRPRYPSPPLGSSPQGPRERGVKGTLRRLQGATTGAVVVVIGASAAAMESPCPPPPPGLARASICIPEAKPTPGQGLEP